MNKKYEKIQLENDFNENEENSDDNSEISSQNNNNPEIEIKELKILIKNSQKLYKKITEFNYIATEKIKSSKYKEALIFLQQSEKILEVIQI